MKCSISCLSGLALSAAVLVGMSAATAGGPAEAPARSLFAADLISGSWEGFVSSDDLPEDVPIWATLEMDDLGDVMGTFGTPDGDAPFEGHFDAEENLLIGTVTLPDASWELELTLDEDELEGEATEANTGMVVTVTLTRSKE